MKRGAKIDYDLDSFPLHIKTDSVAGSEENVTIHFFNAGNNLAGAIRIYFASTIQYRVYPCTNKLYDFPSSLPSEAKKTWRITQKKTPDHDKGVVIQCNGVEVVNRLISDLNCGHPNWSKYWSRDVKKISFQDSDTASDLYFSNPGDSKMIIDI